MDSRSTKVRLHTLASLLNIVQAVCARCTMNQALNETPVERFADISSRGKADLSSSPTG